MSDELRDSIAGTNRRVRD